MALDVTAQVHALDDGNETVSDLTSWIHHLNTTSIKQSGRMLRVALYPRQQMIGQNIYELAFLYDADGSLVELLFKQNELLQTIQSGWDYRWDGTGSFVGS